MFQDRREAGRRLGAALRHDAGRDDVVVLGLPRGGVPVAYEVARAIGAPLDLFLVRKLGVPGHEELAMGAIGPQGVRVLNDPLIRELGISSDEIADVTARESAELSRRERAYRNDRPPMSLPGKRAILVDDGLATGSTMRAAVKALRRLHPASIVVAVPVGAAETCCDLESEGDEVVCLHRPEDFGAVGKWYSRFDQTTDEEVRHLLSLAHDPGEVPSPAEDVPSPGP